MSQEGALLVMIAVAIVFIGLMAWGWWRRVRRDRALVAPFGPVPEAAERLAAFSGLYVATTAHGAALERLAIAGLGYRSRADLIVTDAGIALDLTGQDTIFVRRERLVEASQATVTIDRIVEKDGLARIVWRLQDDLLVDSYFRSQEASARAVAAAIDRIVPHTTPTGSDA